MKNKLGMIGAVAIFLILTKWK